MTTFVLCHGGGMGGWIWKYVTPLLRAAGHEVLTPTYTGFGERIHLIGPNVVHDVHVTDIVNVLKYEGVKDCVLAGHSYSGTVLPGVAAQAPDRVRRLVFFDALVAHAGETVAGSMGMMPPEQAAGVLAAVQSGQAPVGSGVDEQQRKIVKEDPLWMDEDRAAWLMGNLSDMPLACTVSPIATGAESVKVPADYVAASHTIMTPMHERARKLGWTMHELEADHSLIVGQPEWTANLLLGLA